MLIGIIIINISIYMNHNEIRLMKGDYTVYASGDNI